MSNQLAIVPDTRELMKKTGVPKVDLGRFDDTLTNVLTPRLQEPNHERACQQIQIAAARRMRYAERSRNLRPVPDLAVKMGEHLPNPLDGTSWKSRPQRREILIDIGSAKI